MKKRSLLTVVVLTLALCLMLVGCSPEADKEGNGEEEVITLKYVDENPVSSWQVQNAGIPWIEKLEQASGGKVKIDPYFAETLIKGSDIWQGVKNRTADFGWCFNGYYSGMTTLADVVTLPFMPFESAEHGTTVLWQLYEEFPSMREQFSDNHILMVWTSVPYILFSAKKHVKTLEDLQGMKIRTIGGPPTDMAELLGAIPIMMGQPDTYTNLQTGVLDGMFQNWAGIPMYRTHEVAPYITVAPIHTAHFSMPVNKEVWESLPADVKEAFESVSGLEGAKFWAINHFDTAYDEVVRMCEEDGLELQIYTLPDEELARWREKAGEPLWEEWVAEREAEGFSEARDILNRCVELAEAGL